MQLSAELFRRIVRTLSSDERTCAHHEKRKEGRVGLRCSVEITPKIFDDNGEKTLRVWVRDISPSGMGFVIHDQIKTGIELVCSLPSDTSTAIKMVTTVRHCTKLTKGLYAVGVSFDGSAIRKLPKPEGNEVTQPESQPAVAVPVPVPA